MAATAEEAIAQQAPASVGVARPDPLAQLRDIHLPPEPETWPPAPGWWAIAIVVLAIALLARCGRRRWLVYRRNQRFIAEARGSLDRIRTAYHEGHSAQTCAAELNILVRRVALSLYPRAHVAGLHGAAWLEFLARTTANDHFRQHFGDIFTEAPYRPSSLQPHFKEHLELALRAVDAWLIVATKRPGEEA